MYRDAKEELKRLEQALLEEDDGLEAWELDMEEAISDIPDLPPKEKEKKNKVIVGLVIAVILLTAALVGLTVFLLAGGGFSL